jgi:putative transposase
MARVAPSERFRAELDEALASVGQDQDPVEAIGRLGARLILQVALEDEVTEFLGRARYERAEETVSHRNGYEPRKVRTTSGAVELERPRVRDASKLGFESRVLGKHVTRTYALESLVISSFLRGLSTRDVAAVLEETFEEPISSRSTVSRILEDTRERYRRWCARRLNEHDLVYLFCDAIYLKLHPDDEPAEGVLVAWGVTLEGRKVLLGLGLGSRESYEAWAVVRARPRRPRPAPAGADRGRRGARSVEGDQGAVADRGRAALHGARAPQRDREAARAPPPRAQGALVEALRRGCLAGAL